MTTTPHTYVESEQVVDQRSLVSSKHEQGAVHGVQKGGVAITTSIAWKTKILHLLPLITDCGGGKVLIPRFNGGVTSIGSTKQSVPFITYSPVL